MACAPKSNASYMALNEAMESVRQKKTTVPPHLQDAHYRGAKDLGHGTGYKYAHDYPNHYVRQQYLPDGLAGQRFYEPTEMGYEKRIREHLEFLRSGEDPEAGM